MKKLVAILVAIFIAVSVVSCSTIYVKDCQEIQTNLFKCKKL